jgi:hypothetical protein
VALGSTLSSAPTGAADALVYEALSY